MIQRGLKKRLYSMTAFFTNAAQALTQAGLSGSDRRFSSGAGDAQLAP